MEALSDGISLYTICEYNLESLKDGSSRSAGLWACLDYDTGGRKKEPKSERHCSLGSNYARLEKSS